MNEAQEQLPVSDATARWSVPPFPATSAEYITVLAHYHRAEMGRMAGWRDRIDRTTNWAITGVAAMLSLSLSSPTSHHGVLLFAMVPPRHRRSDRDQRLAVFASNRGRVRAPETLSSSGLGAPARVGQRFSGRRTRPRRRKTEFRLASERQMSQQLRRNYLWMFLVLLLAWVLKISTPKLQDDGVTLDVARSLHEIVANAAFGPLPGWAILLGVDCLLLLARLRRPARWRL